MRRLIKNGFFFSGEKRSIGKTKQDSQNSHWSDLRMKKMDISQYSNDSPKRDMSRNIWDASRFLPQGIVYLPVFYQQQSIKFHNSFYWKIDNCRNCIILYNWPIIILFWWDIAEYWRWFPVYILRFVLKERGWISIITSDACDVSPLFSYSVKMEGVVVFDIYIRIRNTQILQKKTRFQ